MSAQVKPPKQTHLEYLLTTIKSEPDQGVTVMSDLFREVRQQLESGQMTVEEARAKMLEYREQAIACCTNKYRTTQLFDATIMYVIDPDLKI